jgi:plastocyanin
MNRLKPVLASIAIIFMLNQPFAHAEELTVTQTDKTFKMNGVKVENLTIKVGDTIKFLNEDPWSHNVFSLSPAKKFDLGSYPKGESKTVTFDTPGIVEIECSIHPQMQLHLEVK